MRPSSISILFAVVTLAGCLGESDTQLAQKRTLNKIAGDNQSIRTGGAVPIAPRVQLVDKDGLGVGGVTVTFAVASGGGTVTAAAPVTDNAGYASIGTWVMGATPGTNTLTASVYAVQGSPVTFTALGQSRTISKVAGDNQSSLAGAAVPVKPKVKIVDQNGAPFVGLSVTFAVASGGGSVTGATVTTGADGTATVGNWILGSTPGTNTLTATSTGITGSPQTFTATGTAAAIIRVDR